MKARTFAEVGLALVGFYSLVHSIMLVPWALRTGFDILTGMRHLREILESAHVIMTAALPLGLAYVLIRHRGPIAGWLVRAEGRSESGDAAAASPGEPPSDRTPGDAARLDGAPSDEAPDRDLRAVETPPHEALFYRLAFVIAGAIVLALALPAFARGILVFVMASRQYGFENAPGQMNRLIWDGHWATLLGFATQCALAAWLLFGAPGLARWHMKDSHERAATAAGGGVGPGPAA